MNARRPFFTSLGSVIIASSVGLGCDMDDDAFVGNDSPNTAPLTPRPPGSAAGGTANRPIAPVDAGATPANDRAPPFMTEAPPPSLPPLVLPTDASVDAG